MSLRFFHILFIAISALMALAVGLWAIDAYRSDRSVEWLGLALLAFVGGALLVVYGNRFVQKTRNLGVAAALAAAGTVAMPADLLACAVCIGNTESTLRDGMNAGILVLLGFAFFMMASAAAFSIYLWRKSKSVDSTDEGEPVHA